MLRIVYENYLCCGHQYDYALENGALLHENEWNGECYTVPVKDTRTNRITEVRYFPIYDENENTNGGYDIIGFEER